MNRRGFFGTLAAAVGAAKVSAVEPATPKAAQYSASIPISLQPSRDEEAIGWLKWHHDLGDKVSCADLLDILEGTTAQAEGRRELVEMPSDGPWREWIPLAWSGRISFTDGSAFRAFDIAEASEKGFCYICSYTLGFAALS